MLKVNRAMYYVNVERWDEALAKLDRDVRHRDRPSFAFLQAPRFECQATKPPLSRAVPRMG